MALLLAATGLFVHQRLAASLDHALDRGLRGRAADVATLAQQSDSGLREARSGAVTAGPAQLIDRRGRVIDRSADAPAAPLISATDVEAARRGGALVRDVDLAAGGPARLRAQPERAQGQTLVIVVAQSVADRNRALDGLTAVLWLGGPVALVLASVLGYLLTGAALRPVDAMRHRAAALSSTNLEQRLPPVPANDELGRLNRTLNELLGRIEASVARERTFVSDASHELRSPLTMLRTELELIARDQPRGPRLRAAVTSAIQETERLAALADDLLMLARADDGHLIVRGAPISATELLRAGLPPTGGPPRVEMCPGDELWVAGDPELLERAVRNLVENARRYARSTVRLEARGANGMIELHVRDDGPGFPEQFLPHAWERFARADSARTEDGAGVGLAIVRVIATAHGGATGARNLEEGGADVWIALRAVPAPPPGLEGTADPR